jgi:hypothetical protein
LQSAQVKYHRVPNGSLWAELGSAT